MSESSFQTWFQKNKILSLVTNGMALYMLNRVSEWGMRYADTQVGRSGVEIGLILAAVGLPAMTFAGWVYKTYKEN